MKKIVSVVIVFVVLAIIAVVYSRSNVISKESVELRRENVEREYIKLFSPIKKPRKGDWLASFKESGQTVDEFCNIKPNFPDSTRNKLYIQPLEDIDSSKISLQLIKEYCEIYYCLGVVVLPILKQKIRKQFSSRYNKETGTNQFLISDIMEYMYYNMIPADAFAVMVVTMTDLYPNENWNFVFGMANPSIRIGVTSLLRYDNAFYTGKDEDNDAILFKKRALKVVTHEFGHQFGINHCTKYQCNMNGCNSMNEADRQPLALCPIEVEKLKISVGNNVNSRYKKLYSFYETNNMIEEADFIAKVLAVKVGKTCGNVTK